LDENSQDEDDKDQFDGDSQDENEEEGDYQDENEEEADSHNEDDNQDGMQMRTKGIIRVGVQNIILGSMGIPLGVIIEDLRALSFLKGLRKKSLQI
jgi:hypothetical protein